MNKKNKSIGDNELFLFIMYLVMFLMVNLLDIQVFRPFFKSDFGKAHSLNCNREKSLPVNCQNYRSGIFQLTSSTVKFQLFDVSIEEYTYPESSSTYALNLVNDTTAITINYDNFEEAQLNYQKLNKLLMEPQESSVSLKYENGFIRWFIIIFLAHVIVMGYILCFSCVVGQLLQWGAFGLNLLKKEFWTWF